MARKSKPKRKSKRNSVVKRKARPSLPNIASPKSTYRQKVWSTLKFSFKVVSVIGLIIGLITGIGYLRDKYKERKIAIRNATTDSGIFIPENFDLSQNMIVVKTGTNLERIHFDGFSSDTYVKSGGFGGALDAADMSFKVQNNNLFIKKDLYDLDGNIIGKIEDNKWEVSKTSKLNYKYDKSNLEVIDKDGYVLLSLSFIYPDTIRFMGLSKQGNFFIVTDSFGSESNTANFKDNILRALKKVPRHFDYKLRFGNGIRSNP